MLTGPVVLDTNTLVSGLRSRNGNSFKLLGKVLDQEIEIAISVLLILEYESTIRSALVPAVLSSSDVDDLLNFICSIGIKTRIFYLWRPLLRHAYDDHILELAVSANSKYIVTYNTKDFAGVEKFGIVTCDPNFVLKKVGGNMMDPVVNTNFCPS